MNPSMEGLGEVSPQSFPKDPRWEKANKLENAFIHSFIQTLCEHLPFCQPIWAAARSFPSVGGILGTDYSRGNLSACRTLDLAQTAAGKSC
jgi:hypothetical protein